MTNEQALLFEAAKEGDTTSVRKILGSNATPDFSDEHGYTPLMVATFYGHLDVVRLLLARTEYLNVSDKDGYTALHIGVLENQVECIEELIKAGADVNIPIRNGSTPLATASALGYTAVIDILKNGE